ncbi:tRNA pseudouridine(55) synthase TruB [Caldisericum exile]|uniref:tRNA pseudouridine synthase B n=1 Tax=Caldisericum exile (strain DSM 21853 / NBRC 104410 / AZM16c01) TaxID=511051 RepID=A0A7U6JEC7_CALEA|nr:tRNA pseudouridine(55) synthase TruB [Caldisericum exile]BAL80586.1 tRNA pseudouridine synthase B [Caldisericum exile AZM16c01]
MEKLTNAFLLISKPYGITSRKFLNEISRVLGEKRIGHLGTLDPMATGLLFVALGKYTRLLPYVNLQTKEYVIEITFGIETDTWDITGKVLKKGDVLVKEEDILKTLPKFTGKIKQRVPFFSARKLKGIELYKLARKETFIETFKDVEILGIEYMGFKNNKLVLKVTSSSGTYMRSLAYELGLALGVPATLSAIVRTKIGNLSIDFTTTINRLKRGDFSKGLVPPQAVIDMPMIIIDGTSFKLGKLESLDNAIVLDKTYNLIGIGEIKGTLKPRVVIDEDNRIP